MSGTARRRGRGMRSTSGETASSGRAGARGREHTTETAVEVGGTASVGTARSRGRGMRSPTGGTAALGASGSHGREHMTETAVKVGGTASVGTARSRGRGASLLPVALAAGFLAPIAWGAAARAAAAVPAEAGQDARDAADAGAGRGSIEAIRCWRRVGRNAVYVGERFDMLVTCSVAETETARAVPDLAGLEPEALAVSPFEVLEGERYGDVVRGPRRFFQYRYALRILGEDYFGSDVELPPLDVRYRIERSLDGAPAVEGRELAYVLPPEPVRVLALVPAAGSDIRELPGETFGDAEARLFRSNLAALGAAALALAAVAAALAAGLGAYRARRGSAAAGAAPLVDWRVAEGALDELAAVRQAVDREGWGAFEIGRAVAALRVAGALALGRPPARDAAVEDAAGRAGQIPVRRGGRRAGVVLLSSAVTPEHLDRALAAGRSEHSRDAHLAEAVRDALRLFGAARYGRSPDVPAETLTAHLDRATAALAERARRAAPGLRRTAAFRGAARVWERAWTR